MGQVRVHWGLSVEGDRSSKAYPCNYEDGDELWKDIEILISYYILHVVIFN